ncbi:hypothetical protein [Winogradskyella sp. PG-2]|uniref:hypothetical protein n=1 Tax=Winogradskyella sp. PG-2 TaxID=754409 RepID=UPI0004587C02|nr:hypothetical protein [Winogradskyella sp. PG-2]BAO77241.1 hypothetical protein WPG_3011 [Winogradskyella sp. PG-2]
MSTRKIVIIVGVILMILGSVLMGLLRDYKYGHLIAGLVIGADGGSLSVLFAPKKDEPKN